jgi:hypothetical protein
MRARMRWHLDQLAHARALARRRAGLGRSRLSGTVVWRGGSGDNDNEEGCRSEQDGLGRAAGLGELRQVLGQDGRVRDDGV